VCVTSSLNQPIRGCRGPSGRALIWACRLSQTSVSMWTSLRWVRVLRHLGSTIHSLHRVLVAFIGLYNATNRFKIRNLHACPTFSIRYKNKLSYGTQNPGHIGKVYSCASVTSWRPESVTSQFWAANYRHSSETTS